MPDENQSLLEHSYPDRKELLHQSLELMKELLQQYAMVCCEIEKTEVDLNPETRQHLEQLRERIKAIHERLDPVSCKRPERSSSIR
jgi:uncharacterized membrane-anchored protein YhcB (DUF1043 family)